MPAGMLFTKQNENRASDLRLLLFQVKNVKCHKPFFHPAISKKVVVILSLKRFINPFAPGNFAEKHDCLKLVQQFSAHCRAIKSYGVLD